MTLEEAMEKPLSYNLTAKNNFHSIAVEILRALASRLKFKPTDYDLRVNKAGTAVSGEVTFHTDYFYIQVSESALGPGREVLYRSCEARNDYTGGQNYWASASELDDIEKFILRLPKVLEEEERK